ncbi:hypothetical protein BBOR36S_00919 [Brevibacillus borstelensis]|jgi:hypothetical protein
MIPGNRHSACLSARLTARLQAMCTVLIPAEAKVFWKIRGRRHACRVYVYDLFSSGKEVFLHVWLQKRLDRRRSLQHTVRNYPLLNGPGKPLERSKSIHVRGETSYGLSCFE